MEDVVTTVTLELHETAGCISGLVVDADGSEHPFCGWLGLMGTVDALLCSATAGPADTPTRSRRTP